MINDLSEHIAIVGGGIAGLSLGCFLQKYGIKNVIYEKIDKIREHGSGISLSPNGIRILNEIGINLEEKNLFYNNKLSLFKYLYKDLVSINIDTITCSRKVLYQSLCEKYIQLGGKYSFNSDIKKLDNTNSCIYIDDKRINFKHIVIANGIKSSFTKNKKFFSGYVAYRGIGKSNLKSIEFLLGKGAHIVKYPINNSGDTNLVAVLKCNKSNSFSWKSKSSYLELSKTFNQFPDFAYDFLNHSDIFKWDIYVSKKNITLIDKNITFIGDSAHSIVPFLGQGACLALEDSKNLANHLKNYHDIKVAQFKYKAERAKRINIIASKSNHQGFLNHLSNPLLIQSRNFLMQRFPNTFIKNRLKKIWED
jgi:salicylate hydroxylase